MDKINIDHSKNRKVDIFAIAAQVFLLQHRTPMQQNATPLIPPQQKSECLLNLHKRILLINHEKKQNINTLRSQ
jgi:hypothetical protein